MVQDFPDISLLRHLEGVADQLGIEVRYEDLADDEFSVSSGGCKLSGRNLILIHLHLTPCQRARILGRELSRHPLENLYILPRVREFILLQTRSREKNLPHR